MKNVPKSKLTGTLLFYILWPLVWVYAPLNTRVRVIIRCKNEVLVVKNWFGPNKWQLPGGGKKKVESIKETASREISEELGISLEELEITELTNKIISKRSYGLNFRYHYVLIELNYKPNIVLSPEITIARWTKIENIDIPIAVKSSLYQVENGIL